MHLPPDITYRLLTFEEAMACPWRDLLPAHGQQRMGQWTHEKRVREFTAGRVAARLLLAERLGVEPAKVPIEVARSGAVHVGGHDLYLSISHSGGRAVAAVGERPVGVDLEQIAARREDLHRFILHPDEYGLFQRLPYTPEEALILCWTLKEAALKAGTTGLRQSPKSLRLEIDPEAGVAVVHTPGEAGWRAGFLRIEDSFMAIAFQP